MAITSPLDIAWTHSFWPEGPEFVASGIADGAGFEPWPDEDGTLDLDAANAFRQPVYHSSVASMGGRPSVEFDGDSLLQQSFATSNLTQPYTLAFVILNITLPSAADGDLFKHSTGGVKVFMESTDGLWYMKSGASSFSGPAADTSAHLVVCEFAGASSSMTFDGTEYAGTVDTAGLAGTFEIGGSSSANYIDAHLPFLAFINRALTSTEKADLLTWHQEHYLGFSAPARATMSFPQATPSVASPIEVLVADSFQLEVSNRRVDVCVHGVGDTPRFGVAAAAGEAVPLEAVSARGETAQPASNAADDDVTTYYADSANYYDDGIAWWRVEFPTLYEIGSWEIHWRDGDVRTFDFDLQTSQDGASWALAYIGPSAGGAAPEVYRFPGVTAKYARIRCYGNTANDWIALYEGGTLRTPDGVTAAPPGAPNVSAPQVVSGAASLSWTRGQGAAESSFKVQRSTSGAQGPWTDIATTANILYTDEGLTDGVTYWWRVVATNADGETASAAVSATPGGGASDVIIGFDWDAGQRGLWDDLHTGIWDQYLVGSSPTKAIIGGEWGPKTVNGVTCQVGVIANPHPGELPTEFEGDVLQIQYIAGPSGNYACGSPEVRINNYDDVGAHTELWLEYYTFTDRVTVAKNGAGTDGLKANGGPIEGGKLPGLGCTGPLSTEPPMHGETITDQDEGWSARQMWHAWFATGPLDINERTVRHYNYHNLATTPSGASRTSFDTGAGYVDGRWVRHVQHIVTGLNQTGYVEWWHENGKYAMPNFAREANLNLHPITDLIFHHYHGGNPTNKDYYLANDEDPVHRWFSKVKVTTDPPSGTPAGHTVVN